MQNQLKLKKVVGRSSSLATKSVPKKKSVVSKSKLSTTSAAKSSKRGLKKGSNVNVNLTLNHWYEACDTFRKKLKVKMSMAQFLKSSHTCDLFDGSKSQQVSFGKYLKKYDNNELKPIAMKRQRERKYVQVEEKLKAYLNLRSQKYKRDKCGISWILIHEKCLGWATELGFHEFKVSAGWIQNTLKYHNLKRIKLHGEAADMCEEEKQAVMQPWREEFHKLIEDKNVSRDRIYNADQSGCFYQKLPNVLYVDKSKEKEFKGTKQMKDKTRVTIMVCTSASGSRLPLAVIGKYKKPTCFKLLNGNDTPLPYYSQNNAWFDKEVTWWWIKNVFWPWHLEMHGDVTCILLLDNCSAHDIDMTQLPKKLIIKFLPPNVTNTHQPADMGMIASLKLGYKSLYLRILLDIFDSDGGYEQAAIRRNKQKRGCKGIHYGGKPHVLDCMEMLAKIWEGKDGKYVSDESICRCWRKADILPVTWNADINNDVGSATISVRDKTLTENDTDELCALLADVKLKAENNSIDTTSAVGKVFSD